MVLEINGTEILNILEFGMRTLPGISSRFSQVSGIKFKVDDSIPSPVVVNDIESYVKVEGEITLDAMDELYLSLSVTGSMDLPCSITLEPVPYPIDIIIEGNLEEFTDDFTKKSLNTIMYRQKVTKAKKSCFCYFFIAFRA